LFVSVGISTKIDETSWFYEATLRSVYFAEREQGSG